MAATSEAIHCDLVPRIRALFRFPARFLIPGAGAACPIAPFQRNKIQICAISPHFAQLKIIAIGVSTDGPDSLANLPPSFPANFPLPVVIVQHMPPIFTALLAKRLASECALPVR